MFAHLLLLVTILFAIGSVVWQSIPYASLVKEDMLYSYDYIIGGPSLHMPTHSMLGLMNIHKL